MTLDTTDPAVDLRTQRARTIRAPRLTALVVFACLTCVQTWPLPTNPAHLGRTDNGDALLNMWTIAWVAHQLPRDPAHLFDANIFYPERLTLAYSEAMLVQGALAMPIVAAGGSPVLAFNLVLLAGLALTGWAFCVLVHRWTGSWSAGYVAGSLAAFNAHVMVRLPHLQTLHVEFIALILFAVDRVIVSKRVRDALLLGVAFALQGLTSIYLLVFSAWMLSFAIASRAAEWLRRGALTTVTRFAIAGATAAALLGLYLLSYSRMQRLTGFVRDIAHSERGAATWHDYLSTASRLHYGWWSYRFMGSSLAPAFPGFVAIGLVVLALTWRETRSDSRLRMCVVAAIGCVTMSMLPRTSVFPYVHRIVPGFMAIRILARLSQIVLLMVAVVAGFGVAGLQRRLRPERAWPVVALALCAMVNVEAMHAPMRFRGFTEIPPVYNVLTTVRGAVVIELPFHPPDVFFANAGYMLNSTRHWHPMLNGYSGFEPASYTETFNAIQSFPGAAALTALHDRGVTHVVVHADGFRGAFGVDRLESLAQTASLMLIGEDSDTQIYKLR